MRRRRLPLIALAAAAGAAVPALAFSEQLPTTASFEAVDFDWRVAGGTSSAVTVAKGATVSFSYPSGSNFHNAAFPGSQPTGCTQTAGPSSGAVPPLPNDPTAPGWAGNCTFDTPGVYAFVCQAHPGMQGTITVADEGGTSPTTTTTTTPTPTTTTPTTTTTTPTTSTPAGTTPPSTTPSPTTLVPSARIALTLARSQRGTRIRGRLSNLPAGSRVTVEALARRSALLLRRSGQIRVGRLTRSSVAAGRLTFTMAVDVRARRALRRAGRLVLQVRARVTPPGAARQTLTGRVTLRR